MTLASTGAKSKPALDESSFQQLLAAAYVVQQHNDGLRAQDPAHATSRVLSEIAEIQSIVRAGGLDLPGSARLTAERLQAIVRADGVAVFLFRDHALDCVAKSGTVSFDPGDTRLAQWIIANPKLRSGELVNTSDLASDSGLAAWQESRVAALIIAPIHCFEEFAGVIQLSAHRAGAFQESASRAAQLMAGLISGLLERGSRTRRPAELSPPSSPAMTSSAHELASATGEPPLFADRSLHITPAEDANTRNPSLLPGDDVFADDLAPSDSLPDECRVCGRPFGPDEAFCGQCSMPRVAGSPTEDLQSKWASMWYMQRAQSQQPPAPVPLKPELRPPPASLASQHPVPIERRRPIEPVPIERRRPVEPEVRIWHVPDARTRPASDHAAIEVNPLKPVTPDKSLFFYESEPSPPSQKVSVPSVPGPPDAVPATTSQDLLHSTWQTVWARMHRRHATLALGAVGCLLLFLVLAVWPSSRSAQVTWFQSLLVQLGIADVPAHPVIFSGNPTARVWVDLHTALYYCEGSDLYGKTPGGHFATQHEAQEDEFGPASGTACR